MSKRTIEIKTPLGYSLATLLLFLCLITPMLTFSQGESCNNPRNINLSNQFQSWSINMSGLSNYYLSFITNDTAVNFTINSINSIPSSLKLYKLSCNNDPVTEALFTTDSNGINKLKLNHYEILTGTEYILVLEQNQSNSLTNIELQGFIPVYNLTPECDLATNGSFEETVTNAPLGDLNEEIEQCKNWRAPINNSRRAPDYFTSNSSDLDYQVPNNLFGNIPSLNTGATNNAYAGMFSVHSGPGNQGNLRELMSTSLNDPLVPGLRYLVEMYVYLAPSTSFFFNNPGIPPGIKFTEEYAGSGQRLIDMSNSQIIALEADIQPTSIISGPGSWVKISDIYIANGGENTLTVANFLSNNESVLLGRQSLSNNLYFFIDEISVTPLDLCCTNPTLVIEDGWDVADLISSNDFAPYISGSTLNAPTVVYIEGEFTVNSNFTIDNTFIKVNDISGKINISSGNTLEINDSEIEACGLMWKGIYVNGTNSEVVIDNSTIADATKGVNSINGGIFTVTNSIFDANYYGIYVDSFNGSHQGFVEETTFECSYLLKDLALSRGHSGIYLNEVINTSASNSITIGSIYAENQFIGPTPGSTNGPFSTLNPGLQYGITINKSSANIFNNEFESFIKKILIDNQNKAGINIIGLPSPSYYPNNYAPIVQIGSNSVSQQNEFVRSTSAIQSEDIVILSIIGNNISFPNNQDHNEQTDFAISIIDNKWPGLTIDV
jgi:hypothetical protein